MQGAYGRRSALRRHKPGLVDVKKPKLGVVEIPTKFGEGEGGMVGDYLTPKNSRYFERGCGQVECACVDATLPCRLTPVQYRERGNATQMCFDYGGNEVRSIFLNLRQRAFYPTASGDTLRLRPAAQRAMTHTPRGMGDHLGPHGHIDREGIHVLHGHLSHARHGRVASFTTTKACPGKEFARRS
jgi:hypothetical protein